MKKETKSNSTIEEVLDLIIIWEIKRGNVNEMYLTNFLLNNKFEFDEYINFIP